MLSAAACVYQVLASLLSDVLVCAFAFLTSAMLPPPLVTMAARCVNLSSSSTSSRAPVRAASYLCLAFNAQEKETDYSKAIQDLFFAISKKNYTKMYNSDWNKAFYMIKKGLAGQIVNSNSKTDRETKYL